MFRRDRITALAGLLVTAGIVLVVPVSGAAATTTDAPTPTSLRNPDT